MSKIPNPNKMKRVKGPTVTKRDLERVKIRITTFIDKDLLVILKQMAAKRGGKYQTLLNSVLRSALIDKDPYEDLWTRMDLLEEALFKKKKAG